MISYREMCVAVTSDTWRHLGEEKERTSVCRTLIEDALAEDMEVEEAYLDLAQRSREDRQRLRRVSVTPETKGALLERVRRIRKEKGRPGLRTPDLLGAILYKAVQEGRVRSERQAAFLGNGKDTIRFPVFVDPVLLETLPADMTAGTFAASRITAALDAERVLSAAEIDAMTACCKEPASMVAENKHWITIEYEKNSRLVHLAERSGTSRFIYTAAVINRTEEDHSEQPVPQPPVHKTVSCAGGYRIVTKPEEGILWTGDNAWEVAEFLMQNCAEDIQGCSVQYMTQDRVSSEFGMECGSDSPIVPILQIAQAGKVHNVLPNTAVTPTRYGVPMEHCTMQRV